MLPEAPARMTVHWFWRAIYVLGLVLALGLTTLSLVTGKSGPAVFFLGLSLLIVFAMVMARAYVEVNHEQVFIYGPPFGKYTIRWDEINNVETNGIAYVFRGNDKALGFNTMMGHNAADLRHTIEAQVTKRGIEVKRVRQTPTTMPKNTRVH